MPQGCLMPDLVTWSARDTRATRVIHAGEEDGPLTGPLGLLGFQPSFLTIYSCYIACLPPFDCSAAITRILAAIPNLDSVVCTLVSCLHPHPLRLRADSRCSYRYPPAPTLIVSLSGRPCAVGLYK